ncbi:Putative RING-H2 finger protein ATL69 (RING-type E3 ubiquitin transferase ATL69), partial [Durusdinium trenchii]
VGSIFGASGAVQKLMSCLFLFGSARAQRTQRVQTDFWATWRRRELQDLGILLAYAPTERGVVIHDVDLRDAQSSLACWNRANPQRPIRVGQVILEVNGLQQGQEMMEEFRRAAYLEMRISNSLSPEMQNMFDMAVHKKRAQEAVESVLHEFPVGAEQGQCSICLCDMNSRVARLPCGHCFHKSCVTEWLIEPRSGQRCPLCNQKLKTDLSEPLFTAFV